MSFARGSGCLALDVRGVLQEVHCSLRRIVDNGPPGPHHGHNCQFVHSGHRPNEKTISIQVLSN